MTPNREESYMELSQILAKCDHTLLAQTATWEEIKAICFFVAL